MAKTTTYNPQIILSTVASAFGMHDRLLYSGRRTQHRTRARSAAAYMLHRTGIYSYSDVARLLHYADHTAARRAALRALGELNSDPYFADLMRALEVQLGIPITNQEHLCVQAEAKTEEPPHERRE